MLWITGVMALCGLRTNYKKAQLDRYQSHSMQLMRDPIRGAQQLKKRYTTPYTISFKGCSDQQLAMLEAPVNAFLDSFVAATSRFDHRGKDHLSVKAFGQKTRSYPILTLLNNMRESPMVFVCDCDHSGIVDGKVYGTVCPKRGDVVNQLIDAHWEASMQEVAPKELSKVDRCGTQAYFKGSLEESTLMNMK